MAAEEGTPFVKSGEVYYDRVTGSVREAYRVPLDGSGQPASVEFFGIGVEKDITGLAVSGSQDAILFSVEDHGNRGVQDLFWSSRNIRKAVEQLGGMENQFPAFYKHTGEYAWSQDGDIWVEDSSLGTYQVTSGPNNDYDPTLASIGGRNYIYFSRHDLFNFSSDIYRVRPNGLQLMPIAAGPRSEDHPSYSHANGKIVYEEAADFASPDDIWVMDPDGSNRVQVTNDPAWDDDDPVWSPDGAWIIWERSDLAGVTNQIMKIAWPPQAGDQPIALTDPAQDARRPAM